MSQELLRALRSVKRRRLRTYSILKASRGVEGPPFRWKGLQLAGGLVLEEYLCTILMV